MKKKYSCLIILLSLFIRPLFGQLTIPFSGTNPPIIGGMCIGSIYNYLDIPLCNSNPWVLILKDEFEKAELNTILWNTKTGVPYDPYFNLQKQWYQGENITLSNGKLRIHVEKEIKANRNYTWWDPTTNSTQTGTSDFDYTSGFLASKYRFGFGKYEIRCTAAAIGGLWPAFWHFGATPNGSTSNELDVFEFIDKAGQNRKHLMNHHYQNLDCSISYVDNTLASGYHTYTLIWDLYTLEWYVDGNLKRKDYRFHNLGTTAPLDCNNLSYGNVYLRSDIWSYWPGYIYANVAVQHGGNPTPNPFTWPSTGYNMDIDYIKYYKKANCQSNVQIQNFNFIDLQNDLYHTVLGSQITAYNSCQLNSNEQIDFIARDRIKLLPNFRAVAGSKFTARIDPTSCPGVPLEGPPSDPIDETPNETKEGLIDNGNIFNSEVSIYPNPISEGGKININAQNKNIVNELTFTVYSMLGQKKIETTINNVENIETSSLKKGMYIYKIFNKNTLVKSGKLVIE